MQFLPDHVAERRERRLREEDASVGADRDQEHHVRSGGRSPANGARGRKAKQAAVCFTHGLVR